MGRWGGASYATIGLLFRLVQQCGDWMQKGRKGVCVCVMRLSLRHINTHQIGHKLAHGGIMPPSCACIVQVNYVLSGVFTNLVSLLIAIRLLYTHGRYRLAAAARTPRRF
jgi:hypothetical protein